MVLRRFFPQFRHLVTLLETLEMLLRYNKTVFNLKEFVVLHYEKNNLYQGLSLFVPKSVRKCTESLVDIFLLLATQTGQIVTGGSA